MDRFIDVVKILVDAADFFDLYGREVNTEPEIKSVASRVVDCLKANSSVARPVKILLTLEVLAKWLNELSFKDYKQLSSLAELIVDLPWSDSLSCLSKREREILNLLVDGYTNKQIANIAFITIGTVKTHLRSIYTKLCVDSNTQAVVTAVTLGMHPRVEELVPLALIVPTPENRSA